MGALGISAMMHGYLALDADGELLTPFRTWRNTNTDQAAEQLSEHFGYNIIPHRWSVAHLYQALLDGEDHVGQVAHLTTLAGYVHWRLTGERILGIGDANGMFPIDAAAGGYDLKLLDQFDALTADRGLRTPLADLLPTIGTAGELGGTLTADGAQLLDPTGTLGAGAPLCPPEGDAGTGMVATNSVAPTGNVSAGSSIFAMVVLEHPLSQVHRALDLVTTPAGDLVAMVHCNNGASELNTWAGLFAELVTTLGLDVDKATVFETLARSALGARRRPRRRRADRVQLPVRRTHHRAGRRPTALPPVTRQLAHPGQLRPQPAVRRPGHVADRLQKDEDVRLDTMFAHGGLFTTKGAAQRFLAAAIDTPVAVGDTASEGGAWGIAVLAAFHATRSEGQRFDDYLANQVFAGSPLDTVEPDPSDVAGFVTFLGRFRTALPVEQAAVEHA